MKEEKVTHSPHKSQVKDQDIISEKLNHEDKNQVESTLKQAKNQTSKIIKLDSPETKQTIEPESPDSKLKKLESENALLKSKFKAMEAELNQKEIDTSCKLTKHFYVKFIIL